MKSLVYHRFLKHDENANKIYGIFSVKTCKLIATYMFGDEGNLTLVK